MKANILDALTIGATARDVEIRNETAAILCALAINDENKIEISMNDCMMANIVTLLKTTDPRSFFLLIYIHLYIYLYIRFYSKKKYTQQFIQKARLSLLHNHNLTIYLIKSYLFLL
jgi:hypothetical protein